MNALFLLLCCVILQFTVNSRECFFSCGDFDDCGIEKCSNVCSGRSQEANLGFTSVECQNDDDLCIYREFLFSRNTGGNDKRSAAIPGGCLLEYQHTTSIANNFFFDEGTNLFTCEGDHCNVPPLERCQVDDAIARKNDSDDANNCVFVGSDDFVGIMQQFSPIRGGNFADPDDRREFCILEPIFRQFETDARCFGTIDPAEPSDCEFIEDLNGFEELEIVTCSLCNKSDECDPLIKTPNPALVLTRSPTRNPSVKPTFSPTLTQPTLSPSEFVEPEPETNPDPEPSGPEQPDPENEPNGSEDDDEPASVNLFLIGGVSCVAFVALSLVVISVTLFRRNKKMKKEIGNTLFVDNDQIAIILPSDPENNLNRPGVEISSPIDNVVFDKNIDENESNSLDADHEQQQYNNEIVQML